MKPFVGNDYRKRVLAAVERRGGPAESDAFELYDLPVDEAERLTDEAVAQRLDEVWAFWQKQRDHPKYRVLVARLVAEHDQRSAPLRHKTGRIAEARAVGTRRELRDQERFELLDNAIARLNERYGGIPASKRAGLDDIGAMGGLSPTEIATRLRRHRKIDDPAATTAPPAPGASSASLTVRQRGQIAELLAEFDRLRDGEPTPTLFTLLHLDTDAAADNAMIASRATALGERARELAAGRLRAVIDELLVHVHEVLLGDPALAQQYRRAVLGEVTEYLRPRVRAAVLVEDELGAHDHEYLLADARARGLGNDDARRILADLAAGFGAPVSPLPQTARPPEPAAASPAPSQHPPQPPDSAWENDLRAARTALRDGLPARARAAVEDARRGAGDDVGALRQIAAQADEIERAVDDAVERFHRARNLSAQRRYVAALELFEVLARQARDIDQIVGDATGLAGLHEVAGRAVAAADELVRTASPAEPAGLAALVEMQREIVDHVELNSAAERFSVEPPRNVRITDAGCTITVRWDASSTPSATYRVVRIEPDGSRRTLGRTPATELDDGIPSEHAPPAYEVTAVVAGRHSVPARSTTRTTGTSAPPPAATPSHPVPTTPVPTTPSPDDPPAISGVRMERGTLRFDWPDAVTEAMVVIRPDAAPEGPGDPRAIATKVTNTRYQIDDGFPLPPDIPRPCHVAVASCRRTPQGALVVASTFGPRARTQAPASEAAG